MDISQSLLLICLLAVIGIMLYKIYNLMNICTIYEEPVAYMLFFGLIMAWLIGFIAFVDQKNVLATSIYNWEQWLAKFTIMLSCVELVMYRVLSVPRLRSQYKHIKK